MFMWVAVFKWQPHKLLTTAAEEHGIWSSVIFMRLLQSEDLRASDLLDGWPQDAKVASHAGKALEIGIDENF